MALLCTGQTITAHSAKHSSATAPYMQSRLRTVSWARWPYSERLTEPLSMVTQLPPTPLLRTDRGTLPGPHPYVAIGNGPRTLAVLPGFGDALFDGEYPPFTGWALAPYFWAYLPTHTVYLLSRPRSLPAGYDAADAVATHSRALESLADPRTGVDVLGISMGGLIGQALARRRPDLVDRLVLANTACRLPEDAHPAVRRLEAFARERDWFSLRAALARALYSDVRAITYPPLIQSGGRFPLPEPADPADVWRSLEFILDFDGCDRLDTIAQPTLVFGGERDPYFTAPVVRETAAGIPNAELTLAPGGKHGAFHERKVTFDARVTTFLGASAPP